MSGKRSELSENLSEPLTERELEVLTCLASGFSNQEIANKLFLAEQTIRWYNSQIYGKLGVNSRSGAVERAQTLGLLPEAAQAPTPVGKHNLPAQATPFIGRQHELVDLNNLLQENDTRLITILAPGGMGKTRLGLEAARLQIGRYADGVIFVPLAPLGNANDIITTIAENIGFSFYGENTPAQQLIDFLRDRSMLLVLDNFEHLLDGAQLIADLMQAVSKVHLLTTSRERLNLRGETVYSLRGLEFPKWETPEDALQYDAVKLFMESAHHVRADFSLQAHDLDYLARICRLTAGMPLGIELAAGWVDVLSLEKIAAEIQKGIDILETEMRDVPERQRSIRATFNYTWGRLTSDEQAIFGRLSIFRGGFTDQAAEAIAGAGVRSLRQLANKALVQVSPDGRHDIHELLRQFGAEKLSVSGEHEDIQAKHAAYFADFMAERKRDIRANRQFKVFQLINPDFENVRSAWLYAVSNQDWNQLPKFLHSLWYYLDGRARGREAVELFEYAVSILQNVPSSDEIQLALGRVLARLGWFNNDIGFPERGADLCDQAIRILHDQNSPDDLLTALDSRCLMAWFQGQIDDLLEFAQKGLEIARSTREKNWEGYFLLWSGTANEFGDTELALHFAESGLAIVKSLEDQFGVMAAYITLGQIKEVQKDYEQATYWFEARLILAETLGHVFHIANSYTALGRISLAQKDYAEAYFKLRKGLQVYWSGGYKWIIVSPLVVIAQFLAEQNEVERAVEIRAAIDKHLVPFEQTDRKAQILRSQLETMMEPEQFAAAWARGEKQELSAVVAELLSANVNG